ncbi:MAG: hypothetical protein BRC51_14705 [Cyanobacteria bacterium SW_12_48_29]|jgi:diguanylate cyclase (GGDEF)-like protein/PAS domain S-box-containing protein|nr:MAG: hypothetical protein BRC51_14705 [Cyanobacteria bacterium SW_12_48_29]
MRRVDVEHDKEKWQVSEQLCQVIFSNIGDTVFLSDDAGAFTYICHSVEEILGYSPQQIRALGNITALLGENIFAPEQLDALGKISNIEREITNRAGTQQTLLIDVKRVSTQWGTVLYSCRDITEYKQALVALHQRENQIRTLVENSPEIIVRLDRKLRYVYANPAVEQATGIPASAFIGKTNSELEMPAELVSYWHASLEKVFETAEAELIEFDFPTPSGVRSYQAHLAPEYDEDDSVEFVLVVVSDINQRKQAEQALRKQAEQERLIAAVAQRIRQYLDLAEILDTTVEEVRQSLLCDRVLVYRFHSDGSGVIEAESVGGNWRTVLGTNVDDPCFTESYILPYQEGRVSVFEDIYTANISPCYIALLAQFQVRANLVLPIFQGEQLWGLLIAHHCAAPRQWQSSEINLLKQLATQVGIATQQAELYHQLELANQRLQHLALVDQLTQVANRRRFDEYLALEWQRQAREKGQLSLILCDIDDFKRYNDTYGHPAGDDCLQQVAQTLTHVVHRPCDLVARYGGEEFAMLLPNTESTGAMHIAETIQTAITALRMPHLHSRASNYVTLGLGVASVIPEPKLSPHELVKRADGALYHAKEMGGDQVVASQVPSPLLKAEGN